jgi:hypothetical protein
MSLDPDKVKAKVVKLLYDERAMDWSIQDKGELVAAVKLQLSEKRKQAEE